MDMGDVRGALFAAYSKAAQGPYGVEGKSAEALCELQYPTWWDAKSEDEFCTPCGIMIYSYVLGPSRHHYIERADVESHPNYYTWRGPDIYATAVRVINEWAEQIGAEDE